VGVARQAVEPVFLSGALHDQQGAGEEGKAYKVWRAVLLAELEDTDGAQRDGGYGRIAAQLRVDVGVPAAHVVAVAVQVAEARVELVTRHSDQSVQQVQQLRCPVQILHNRVEKRRLYSKSILFHYMSQI
jgi:hypothetical protein